MDELSPSHGLTKEQKTGFVLLLLFGILAVVLGFLQMRNTIYGPIFAGDSQDFNPVNDGNPGVRFVESEATRLQRIDTDQDGLNDFDEIEFYRTSRYLPDTDSDGILDGEEIKQGTDPTCAEGSVCAAADAIPTVEKESPFEGVGSELVNSVATPFEIVTGATVQAQLPAGSLDLEQLAKDPEKIRDLLAATGQVTAKQLDSFTDEQLIVLVKELLQEQGLAVPGVTDEVLEDIADSAGETQEQPGTGDAQTNNEAQ